MFSLPEISSGIPSKGKTKIRTAPDVMVAFGRPKGYRGSYMQWEEGGIPPQVVFEILSPGNRTGEMMRKFKFYERFGVSEYYICDPYLNSLVAYHRSDGKLVEVDQVDQLVEPEARHSLPERRRDASDLRSC